MESGENLRERIRKAGLSDLEIEARMEGKRKEFGGLLSEEGMLTVIATELGVFSSPKTLISELKEGDEVNIQAHVSGLTSIREFSRPDGSTGRVMTVFLADETGEIPLTLWDNECRLTEDLKKGDAIRVIGGTVKGGQRGLQIFLGRGKFIANPEEVSKKETRKPARRMRLSEVAEGKGLEIRGTIAKLYPLRVYEACPECFKSVAFKNNEYFCNNCARKVIARKVLIAEVGIDDCTGYIRATFFDRRAERLLGIETREASFELKEISKKISDRKEAGLRYMFEHHHGILGREILAQGDIIASEYSGFVLRVYDFGEPDIKEEAVKILEGFS